MTTTSTNNITDHYSHLKTYLSNSAQESHAALTRHRQTQLEVVRALTSFTFATFFTIMADTGGKFKLDTNDNLPVGSSLGTATLFYLLLWGANWACAAADVHPYQPKKSHAYGERQLLKGEQGGTTASASTATSKLTRSLLPGVYASCADDLAVWADLVMKAALYIMVGTTTSTIFSQKLGNNTYGCLLSWLITKVFVETMIKNGLENNQAGSKRANPYLMQLSWPFCLMRKDDTAGVAPSCLGLSSRV